MPPEKSISLFEAVLMPAEFTLQERYVFGAVYPQITLNRVPGTVFRPCSFSKKTEIIKGKRMTNSLAIFEGCKIRRHYEVTGAVALNFPVCT